MDLSLGFPEFSQELAISTKASLESVVSSSSNRPSASRIRRCAPSITSRPWRAFSPDMPGSVDPRLRGALERRGITRLYSHQAEAFEHLEAGRNVVIVTPTASGKTLCYNLPVLNRAAGGSRARAPCTCFPPRRWPKTSSHELQAAVDEMGSGIRAFTYDGDTPQDARKAIRQRANIVLTNPDMLHSGILPHHTKWARLFREPALHRHRRAALLPRRLTAATWRTCCGGCGASANSTARSRSSSAARRPSPIRGSWPRR